MNTQLLKQTFLYSMAAYVLSLAFPDLAFATGGGVQDLATASQQVTDQVGKVPQIVNSLLFVGGITLVSLGLLDLKKNADNPANNPLKNGISKCLVGGACVALPAGIGAMKQTVGLNASSPDINATQMNF